MIAQHELTVAVVAKECVPGRVKTRLTPPYSHEQAARIAFAALHDTLATVSSLPVGRRVLFLDGEMTPPSEWEVISQPSGSLDIRLAELFDEIRSPLLLVGMDTPQLSVTDIAGPLDAWNDEIDAWIGDAADGGFWAIALRDPHGELVRGVPMSRPDTGEQQRERLSANGLSIASMPMLRDVDTADDARAVAALAPESHFARVLAGETV